MAEELAAPDQGRTLAVMLRYVLGIVIGAVVLLLLFGKRGELVAALHQLASADPAWVAAAVLAESLSMLAFGLLQHRVLGLSGSRIALPGLVLLSVANDAIACTVPGEPAPSSAYRYRYYRRHGARAASAGWTIFTILIAQAMGLSLLLLTGVLIALAGSSSATGAGVTVVGLVIILGAGAVLVRRDLVLRLIEVMVRGLRRLTGHPRGSVGTRVEATLARMREIPLSRSSTVGVVAIATATWCCDFLCLLCSFRAVHATIPWSYVLLAYGAAVVVGSLPIVPGGLGLVEGSLAVILIAYGVGRVPAVSAALAFRLVNYWLAIPVGWLAVGLIAGRERLRGDRGREPAVGPDRPAAGPDLPAAAASPPD